MKPQSLSAFKGLLAISLAVLVAASSGTAFPAARAEASTPPPCPGGKLSSTLPKAPPGMTARQTVTIDANCKPVWGPVEFVPREAVSHAPEKDVKTGTFKRLQADVKDTPTRLLPQAIVPMSLATVHNENDLFDPVGILLNKLYTDMSYGFDGWIVTSYDVGGGYSYHTEYGPCGSGWYPVNPFSRLTAGGAGDTEASFQQHVEFGYKGTFDCMDNWETVWGNGSHVCSQDLHSRNWFPGWSWQHHCP